MKKLLPIIFAVFGLAGGVGAGVLLRPAPADVVALDPCGDAEPPMPTNSQPDLGANNGNGASNGAEYVKLNNQFVVPVVTDERIVSLVVMSLSLEIESGGQETVYQREPKLRDEFLQVLFDHSNAGGFAGAFTSGAKMKHLRTALLEAARKTLGQMVSDVLIVDVVRQDA